MTNLDGYRELWNTAHALRPSEITKGGTLDVGMYDLVKHVVSTTPRPRFVRPSTREWVMDADAWHFPMGIRIESALAMTYKGLINCKTPFDLAVYTRLIWELQPRTILELGSFQGGSTLWFADQLQTLCEHPGEVHSFDVNAVCVSPRAHHPHNHFHFVDLTDLSTFDRGLLLSLPHPWLVVDDAHVRIAEVFAFLDPLLETGDYYVVEDAPHRATSLTGPNRLINAARRLRNRLNKKLLPIYALSAVFEDAGYLIDRQCVDAWGYNVTCAPNSWYRKM